MSMVKRAYCAVLRGGQGVVVVVWKEQEEGEGQA